MKAILFANTKNPI